MSAPASFDEMEAKRQMMIASFTQIANAMRQCVACIEDYTRHDPGNISNATTSQALAQLPNFNGEVDSFDSSSGAPADSKSKSKSKATPGPKPKKEKKQKVVRDPNQPKRPTSAYLLYQNAVRPTLPPNPEDVTYHDKMRRVASMWKELEPAQKKLWEDMYAKEKAVYDQEEQEYRAGQGAGHTAPGTVDPSALTNQSANHAAPAAPSSDSSDSSSDSSDDELPPAPPPAPKPVKALKAASTPQTPATLAAAAATPKTGAKEKKRKQKDVEQPAAPVTPATGEKKKKKKTQE